MTSTPMRMGVVRGDRWPALAIVLLMLGASCSQNDKCGPGAVDSAAGSGAGLHKRVFVSRATYSAALGGLTGADAKCQMFADAAALGGTWKAWLSDSHANAIDRMADVGPWHLLHGDLIFRDKAQLQGFPSTAAGTDELGNSIANPVIWTGTLLGGNTSYGSTANIAGKTQLSTDTACSDWSTAVGGYGMTGYMFTTAQEWTQNGLSACDANQHLLCFEQ